jgi:hypothetical protein
MRRTYNNLSGNSNYTQLKSLSSSGSQFIVTNCIIQQSYRYVVECEDYDYANNNHANVFSSYNPNKNKIIQGRLLFLIHSLNKCDYSFGGAYKQQTLTSQYKDKVICDVCESNITFRDENNTESFTPTNVTSLRAANLCLFCADAGASGNVVAYCKIYNFKVYTDSIATTPIYEYIPAIRNADGEIGIYDIINDVFYTNAGTGTFLYETLLN